MISATGAKGTALIFFDTTIHCSPSNFSPWKRSIFSLIVNPVSTAYTNTERPDHLHHKDLTPVTPGDGAGIV
jgi:ectoine hydroxylase